MLSTSCPCCVIEIGTAHEMIRRIVNERKRRAKL